MLCKQTKLTVEGDDIVYSTLVGGSGSDLSAAIALDADNNPWITGSTTVKTIPDFPNPSVTLNTEAFVAQIVPKTIVIPGIGIPFRPPLIITKFGVGFGAYLSGDDFDRGLGIAVDIADQVYVAGVTRSTDFATLNAFQPDFSGGFDDGFVVKFGPAD